MPSFRSRPADIGRARAGRLAVTFGTELRTARVNAGLTQRLVARLAGASQQVVSKAERGAGDLSLEMRCRLVAATGHELGWRLYPTRSISLRDSGQLALAQVIAAASAAHWRVDLERSVAPGDMRAADLVLTSASGVIHVEVERSLTDLQAQLRAAQLKRDALQASSRRPIRLVLAVPDTRTARRRLDPFTDLIRHALPTSSRSIWTALSEGAPLAGDGLLFVRERRRAAGSIRNR
jgi:transcriptional regulator with XRE-family HTH domain